MDGARVTNYRLLPYANSNITSANAFTLMIAVARWSLAYGRLCRVVSTPPQPINGEFINRFVY
jgi:hypothetical protein